MKVRAENNSGLQDLLNTIEMDGRLETITSHVATSVLENSGVVIEPGKK